MQPRPVTPPIDRLWPKLSPTDDGCWIFTGHVDPQGYGRLKGGRRGAPVLYAHILVYETLVGPVPPELELDHLCRVRRCCQPGHLEPVTHRVNMERGINPRMRAHLAGTCEKGHGREQFYISPKTGRGYCRECRQRRRDTQRLLERG